MATEFLETFTSTSCHKQNCENLPAQKRRQKTTE